MQRLLIGALALAFAAAVPAAAENREHAGSSHPTAHASHPAAHHRTAAHRPTTSHRTVRTTTHRTHHGTKKHTVRRTTKKHTAHGTVRHTTKKTVVRHGKKRTVVRETKKSPATHVTVRFAKQRRAIQATKRFHAGAYRRPAGWYAHHWVIGERLPRPWFGRDYWVTDWAIYGLWAPIDGLAWVRVGPDAVLIDPVTGEVIGIEYGIFW
jgi:Ni/Co efflux regulator RcnB